MRLDACSAIGCRPPDRSMTAKRRCPKPTGPEIYTPPSSGPRWKRLAVIWSKSDRLGDIPSFRFTIPTIPHIVHPPDDSLDPSFFSLIFSLVLTRLRLWNAGFNRLWVWVYGTTMTSPFFI